MWLRGQKIPVVGDRLPVEGRSATARKMGLVLSGPVLQESEMKWTVSDGGGCGILGIDGVACARSSQPSRKGLMLPLVTQ